MEWRKREQRYGPHSMHLFLGKFHVATVAYSSSSKDASEKYRCGIHMPGMKDKFTNSKHASEAEAMEFAQAVVNKWIKSAGLSVSSK